MIYSHMKTTPMPLVPASITLCALRIPGDVAIVIEVVDVEAVLYSLLIVS